MPLLYRYNSHIFFKKLAFNNYAYNHGKFMCILKGLRYLHEEMPLRGGEGGRRGV